MAVFRVIPDNDILLERDPETGKKVLVLVRGPAYVKQKLRTRFRFFAGEWFRNAREGVQYRRDVFVRNPDLELLRSTFREIIRSVVEVRTIDRFELTYDVVDRVLFFDFSLSLADGSTLVVSPNDRAFIIDFGRPT